MEVGDNRSKNYFRVCATGFDKSTSESEEESNIREEETWKDVDKEPGEEGDPGGVQES